MTETGTHTAVGAAHQSRPRLALRTRRTYSRCVGRRDTGHVKDDGRAARWLEADYDGPTFSGPRLVPKLIGSWLRALLWDEPDIAADCRAVVRRRDNGLEVAVFEYRRVNEAHEHVVSLRDRLAQLTLFDFTRDVGVPFEKVADARPIDDV